MQSGISRGVRRTAIVVAATMLSMLCATFAPPKATAAPAEFDFNILGFANADNWGNRGNTRPVTWLRDVYRITHALGDTWPISVAVEEVCYDPNNTANQYDTLLRALWGDTGNLYLQKFTATGGHTAGRSLCTDGGTGIYALANSPYSAFAPTFVHSYADQEASDNSAPRKMTCLKPTLLAHNYIACVTHLTQVSPSTAELQLAYAESVFRSYTGNGYDVLFSGDFNLNKNRPGLDSWYSTDFAFEFDGDRAGASNTIDLEPNHATAKTDKKIDYIWSWGFIRQQIGTVADPPYYTSSGTDSPYSDHRLLRGYAG